MSDAWGGKAGSSAVFDPPVVKQLLTDFERDVDSLEQYYNSINVDTMQRRETHKMTRQRAYDTSNRLRALLALPAKSGAQSGEKDRLLSQAQQILNRFADVTRRTVDIDGEIVHQMRKSLSSACGDSTRSFSFCPFLHRSLLAFFTLLPLLWPLFGHLVKQWQSYAALR